VPRQIPFDFAQGSLSPRWRVRAVFADDANEKVEMENWVSGLLNAECGNAECSLHSVPTVGMIFNSSTVLFSGSSTAFRTAIAIVSGDIIFFRGAFGQR